MVEGDTLYKRINSGSSSVLEEYNISDLSTPIKTIDTGAGGSWNVSSVTFDNETIYLADTTLHKIFAYNKTTGDREPNKDFSRAQITSNEREVGTSQMLSLAQAELPNSVNRLPTSQIREILGQKLYNRSYCVIPYEYITDSADDSLENYADAKTSGVSNHYLNCHIFELGLPSTYRSGTRRTIGGNEF